MGGYIPAGGNHRRVSASGEHARSYFRPRAGRTNHSKCAGTPEHGGAV